MSLFSVITVCRNPGPLLALSVKTLQNQTFRDFEHIIIDGGSNDGTLDYLKQNSHLFAKVISEPDNGIYDAMNKGINQATGVYIYFLNCGDEFNDVQVLEKIGAACKASNADVVYGDTLLVDKKKNTTRVKSHAGVDRFFLFHRPINHQAIFARRSVFERSGLFDTSYVVKADHEWTMRCYNAGAVFRHVPVIVSSYLLHGFAYQNRAKYRAKEKKRLQYKHFKRSGMFLARTLHRLGITPGGSIRNLLNAML